MNSSQKLEKAINYATTKCKEIDRKKESNLKTARRDKV